MDNRKRNFRLCQLAALATYNSLKFVFFNYEQETQIGENTIICGISLTEDKVLIKNTNSEKDFDDLVSIDIFDEDFLQEEVIEAVNGIALELDYDMKSR